MKISILPKTLISINNFIFFLRKIFYFDHVLYRMLDITVSPKKQLRCQKFHPSKVTKLHLTDLSATWRKSALQNQTLIGEGKIIPAEFVP